MKRDSSASKTLRSGGLKRILHRWKVGLISTWLRSLRCNPESTPNPVILTLWHQDLPVAMAALKHRNIHVMISASSDGQTAAECATSLGYTVVAGSGSRKPQALRHLLKALSQGYSVGMALDGPRGPAGSVFPGTEWLAEQSGCTALHLKPQYGAALKINTWDTTRIPLPFSKHTLRFIPWNPADEKVPENLTNCRANS